MGKRQHGILVLGLSGAFLVFSVVLLLELSFGRDLERLTNLFAWFSMVVGLHFLWRTGIYQISPLSKFNNFAFALLIMGALLSIMHWPYSEFLTLAAFGSTLILYGIHFFLKRHHRLGDILRLLVIVLITILFPMAYFHIIAAIEAYLAAIGMISLATLEWLLNPRTNEGKFEAKKQHDIRQDEHDNLKHEHPDLFD